MAPFCTSFQATSRGRGSTAHLGAISRPSGCATSQNRVRALSLSTRASAHGHGATGPGHVSHPPHPQHLSVQAQPQSLQQQQPSQNSPERLCRVTFSIKYQTGFGRSLKVIGHGEALGSWNLAAAPALTWGSDDVWSVTLDLPQSSVVEYKYAMIDSYGNAVAWQSGNNNVLAVKMNQDEMTVIDNWEGAPSASVSSNGAVVPRQNQLLNWASEMELMLASSKNELRQSRVELMAAREEAKVARSQVDSLRKEVAEFKVIEKRQKAEIEALQAEVHELRAQQTESTMGFTAAFETAHSILDDLDIELGLDSAMFDNEDESDPFLQMASLMETPLEKPLKDSGKSSPESDAESSETSLKSKNSTAEESISSWRARQRPAFTNFISPSGNDVNIGHSPSKENEPPTSGVNSAQDSPPNNTMNAGAETSNAVPMSSRPSSLRSHGSRRGRSSSGASTSDASRIPVTASSEQSTRAWSAQKDVYGQGFAPTKGAVWATGRVGQIDQEQFW